MKFCTDRKPSLMPITVFRIHKHQIQSSRIVREKLRGDAVKLDEIRAIWRNSDGFGFEGPFEVDAAHLDPHRPGCMKEMP